MLWNSIFHYAVKMRDCLDLDNGVGRYSSMTGFLMDYLEKEEDVAYS